ncbi:MAG: SpaA isopeptide-forming pilin-related protein, partial [Oscillospiraceae bacterium]|nr:SpaA isopeptide-forming pilin-related protein [Oscillospiraceae bacterium]
QSDGTLVKEATPLSSDLYRVTYDTDSSSSTYNQFVFSFTSQIADAYQLEFTTDILVKNMTVKNSISFQGQGIDATAKSDEKVIQVSDTGAGGGGSTGSISIHKADAADPSISLSGAKFILLNINQDPIAGKEVTTDASGNASFDQLLYKTYYLKETEPPAGYLLNTTLQKFRLKTGASTFNYTFENEKALGTISFTKTDLSGTPLNGGEFTLTGNDYAGNPVSMTAQSVSGTVTFYNVPLGSNYTIKETKAPAGYYKSSTELQASVAYNTDKTAVTTVISAATLQNTPIPGVSFGSVEITKTDESGQKLQGAVFTLYTANGQPVATAVSNASGVASFNQVAVGEYILKETSAPEGYELNPQSINISMNDTYHLHFTMVNKQKPVVPVTPGSIQLLKTDQEGKGLSGAEFTLYDADGNVLKTAVTDANGRAEFKDVPPGSYIVSETRAPDGYAGSSDRISVTVTSGTASSVTVQNQKIVDHSGSLSIKKVDPNGHPLAGAEFTLYGENGAVVAKAVSNAEGFAQFEGLAPGKYSVRETVAPKGYALETEPLTFVLTENQKLSYTLQNNPLPDDSGVPDKPGTDSQDNGHQNQKPSNPGQPNGKLPKTGGVSGSFLGATAGIALTVTGWLTLRKSKKHGKNKS